MGIRRRESRWKHQLNEWLAKHASEIVAILQEYQVPLLDSQDQLLDGTTISAVDAPSAANARE